MRKSFCIKALMAVALCMPLSLHAATPVKKAANAAPKQKKEICLQLYSVRDLLWDINKDGKAQESYTQLLKRLHAMGYEKVGLWGISKGAELALTAGSPLPGLVNAVVAVAPMNTVCQAFVKGKGIVFLPGSCWSFPASGRC